MKCIATPRHARTDTVYWRQIMPPCGRQTKTCTSDRQRGITLIMVLWLMVLLTVIAIACELTACPSDAIKMMLE